MLTCPSCGDLNRPEAERCAECNKRLFLPGAKNPLARRRPRKKKAPSSAPPRRKKGQPYASPEPRDIGRLVDDWYEGK